MKALIIKDTYISGTPVFKGQVRDLDENTFRLLSQGGKVVDADKATPEQQKLIADRKKIEAAGAAKPVNA